ncbi:zinc finger MYND domain-containing protein 10 [Orussus abietinus]|uniref:zinc finger MYND domain-containing protein 10 n=1 Tax=Orussus abietinus TaxID=222816 RepID=UPI0006250205|nr:zinc finger MYND domain-containing protein 10 [Orussus abietinus]
MNRGTVLSHWEIQSFVESLKDIDLSDIGTKCWFELHKKLILLNQQSITEIHTSQEEYVKEWFINLHKAHLLVQNVIEIDIWKQNIFPLLIEINGEPSNTFILYSVFYHEQIAVSLLENILYHVEGAEAIQESVLDLIDYAVHNVITFLHSTLEDHNGDITEFNTPCLMELTQKRSELDFDICMRCVSILRYLSEYTDNLPLCALSRMLIVHDVPSLLIELVKRHPWKRQDESGNTLVFNGRWNTVTPEEGKKMCKMEGQVWIGLRELLLNPKSATYYDINEYRFSRLLELQKYLHEETLDQIAPLLEFRQWLARLSVSNVSSNVQKPVLVEQLPQIRSSILKTYKKQWRRLATHQSKLLYINNAEEVRNIAKILNNAYDFDVMIPPEERKCFQCKNIARKRCSQCKEAWYCTRNCQVKDWNSHKETCARITMSKKEAY